MKEEEVARYNALSFQKYEEFSSTLFFRIQLMCDSKEWNKVWDMYLSVCVWSVSGCGVCTVHIYACTWGFPMFYHVPTHVWVGTSLVKEFSSVLPTNVYALCRNMQAWELWCHRSIHNFSLSIRAPHHTHKNFTAASDMPSFSNPNTIYSTCTFTSIMLCFTYVLVVNTSHLLLAVKLEKPPKVANHEILKLVSSLLL